MQRSKHGLFVFSPKKTLIWRRHCSIGQSCCSMTSKRSIDWFLESSSGMKFFHPSVRLTNQKLCAFVSVRYTNQIALFSFVCCFCFVSAFSFQGHTKIALKLRLRSHGTGPAEKFDLSVCSHGTLNGYASGFSSGKVSSVWTELLNAGILNRSKIRRLPSEHSPWVFFLSLGRNGRNKYIHCHIFLFQWVSWNIFSVTLACLFLLVVDGKFMTTGSLSWNIMTL